MPSRETKTGFAVNAGTVAINHMQGIDLLWHRSRSMGAPLQDPNGPHMGAIVAMQGMQQELKHQALTFPHSHLLTIFTRQLIQDVRKLLCHHRIAHTHLRLQLRKPQ